MKENMKNLVLVFSLILNLAFLGGTAYYTLSPHPGACMPSGSCPFLYQELNLSREQLARVEPIRDRFHERLSKIAGSIKAKQIQLVDLLGAQDFDSRAVNHLQEEIQTLQQSMQDTVITHIREETMVFTPEQRRTFFKLMKERIASRGHPGPPWMRPSKQGNTVETKAAEK
jgi:Spy/CpxP family protein refolding chaperone